MSISKLCEYFEDIGLVNLSSIHSFLSIYSQLSKSSKAILPNGLIKAKYALFNYMKQISSSKEQLLDYCNQIIEKYSAWTMLKQYLFLSKMVIVLRYKINRQALILLYKMKHFNNRRKGKEKEKGKGDLNVNAFKSNRETKMNNRNQYKTEKSVNISYNSAKDLTQFSLYNKNNNCTQSRNEHLNNDTYLSGVKMHKTSLMNQTYSIRNNNDNHNNNNSSSNNIVNNKPYLNQTFSNLKSKPKYNPSNTNTNINTNINTKRNRYQINQTEESFKDKERLLTTQHTSSVDRFYLSQERHIIDHQRKVLNLKLNKLKQMDSICTFKPSLSHKNLNYKSKSYNHSLDIPRYIKLNHDALIHKDRLTQLKLKYQQEEHQAKNKARQALHVKTDTINSLPNESYYEKLYHDAYEYQRRRQENQRNYYATMTFHPTNINNNICIKSNFQERNQQSIEKKQKLRKSKEKEDKKDHLSKEKIEENNRKVIDRLYHRDIHTDTNQHSSKKQLTYSKDIKQLRETKKKRPPNKANLEATNLLHEIKKEHVINYKLESNNTPKNMNLSSFELCLTPNANETENIKQVDNMSSVVLNTEPISYCSKTMQNLLISKHN